MRLLIISNMAHYSQNGQIVGWGPTVEEIDYLSTLFSEVCHIACLHDGPVPASSLPYQARNIRIEFVPPSGGNQLKDKINILRLFPQYAKRILKELPQADVVHIRAPANISLLAILLLSFRKQPTIRWIKYANNWKPRNSESKAYTFQRWWLTRNFAHAHVTVNGEWINQPANIHSFFNPCLTDEERENAAIIAKSKSLGNEIKILFAGRVETPKGVGTAIEIIRQLRQDGINSTLEIAGDGPEKPFFEKMARDLGVEDFVDFRGWIAHPEMVSLYQKAHIILLPTIASEGWPKVLGEAMAYGVVPIASDISSIGQYLGRFATGKAISSQKPESFANAVRFYLEHPTNWKEESLRGVLAAKNFTYEIHCERVKSMLGLASQVNY